MYNDIFWGRSGPQAVINITETLKSKRMAMVDEVKRALDIAEVIPFATWSSTWAWRGGVRRAQGGGGFQLARRADAVRAPRGVEILLENIPTNFPPRTG